MRGWPVLLETDLRSIEAIAASCANVYFPRLSTTASAEGCSAARETIDSVSMEPLGEGVALNTPYRALRRLGMLTRLGDGLCFAAAAASRSDVYGPHTST